MDISKERLLQERKNWRKDHPFGFVAKPDKSPEGGFNIFKWRCLIPGVKGTVWEGAMLLLMMEFSEEYPNKPPKCQFVPPLPHPNIYPSGTVWLSILNEDEDWNISITIPTILKGIQDLLDNPNVDSPAQLEAFVMFKEQPDQYYQQIKEYIVNNWEKNQI